MAALGVHFALTAEDVSALRGFDSDEERLDYIQEVIEEEYLSPDRSDNPHASESDKAWDAMHRVLTDGRLTWEGGQYPLNHTVLAGELLYFEPDYIMSLKSPEQVKDIANSLEQIDHEDFRSRYYAIDSNDYGFPLTDEDFEYTWEWFQNVRKLYRVAAETERYVLFTADQ